MTLTPLQGRTRSPSGKGTVTPTRNKRATEPAPDRPKLRPLRSTQDVDEDRTPAPPPTRPEGGEKNRGLFEQLNPLRLAGNATKGVGTLIKDVAEVPWNLSKMPVDVARNLGVPGLGESDYEVADDANWFQGLQASFRNYTPLLADVAGGVTHTFNVTGIGSDENIIGRYQTAVEEGRWVDQFINDAGNVAIVAGPIARALGATAAAGVAAEGATGITGAAAEAGAASAAPTSLSAAAKATLLPPALKAVERIRTRIPGTATESIPMRGAPIAEATIRPTFNPGKGLAGAIERRALPNLSVPELAASAETPASAVRIGQAGAAIEKVGMGAQWLDPAEPLTRVAGKVAGPTINAGVRTLASVAPKVPGVNRIVNGVARAEAKIERERLKSDYRQDANTTRAEISKNAIQSQFFVDKNLDRLGLDRETRDLHGGVILDATDLALDSYADIWQQTPRAQKANVLKSWNARRPERFALTAERLDLYNQYRGGRLSPEITQVLDEGLGRARAAELERRTAQMNAGNLAGEQLYVPQVILPDNTKIDYNLATQKQLNDAIKNDRIELPWLQETPDGTIATLAAREARVEVEQAKVDEARAKVGPLADRYDAISAQRMALEKPGRNVAHINTPEGRAEAVADQQAQLAAARNPDPVVAQPQSTPAAVVGPEPVTRPAPLPTTRPGRPASLAAASQPGRPIATGAALLPAAEAAQLTIQGRYDEAVRLRDELRKNYQREAGEATAVGGLEGTVKRDWEAKLLAADKRVYELKGELDSAESPPTIQPSRPPISPLIEAMQINPADATTYYRGVPNDQTWSVDEATGDLVMRGMPQGHFGENVNAVSFTTNPQQALLYAREGVKAGMSTGDVLSGTVFEIDADAVHEAVGSDRASLRDRTTTYEEAKGKPRGTYLFEKRLGEEQAEVSAVLGEGKLAISNNDWTAGMVASTARDSSGFVAALDKMENPDGPVAKALEPFVELRKQEMLEVRPESYPDDFRAAVDNLRTILQDHHQTDLAGRTAGLPEMRIPAGKWRALNSEEMRTVAQAETGSRWGTELQGAHDAMADGTPMHDAVMSLEQSGNALVEGLSDADKESLGRAATRNDMESMDDGFTIFEQWGTPEGVARTLKDWAHNLEFQGMSAEGIRAVTAWMSDPANHLAEFHGWAKQSSSMVRDFLGGKVGKKVKTNPLQGVINAQKFRGQGGLADAAGKVEKPRDVSIKEPPVIHDAWLGDINLEERVAELESSRNSITAEINRGELSGDKLQEASELEASLSWELHEARKQYQEWLNQYEAETPHVSEADQLAAPAPEIEAPAAVDGGGTENVQKSIADALAAALNENIIKTETITAIQDQLLDPRIGVNATPPSEWAGGTWGVGQMANADVRAMGPADPYAQPLMPPAEKLIRQDEMAKRDLWDALQAVKTAQWHLDNAQHRVKNFYNELNETQQQMIHTVERNGVASFRDVVDTVNTTGVPVGGFVTAVDGSAKLTGHVAAIANKLGIYQAVLDTVRKQREKAYRGAWDRMTEKDQIEKYGPWDKSEKYEPHAAFDRYVKARLKHDMDPGDTNLAVNVLIEYGRKLKPGTEQANIWNASVGNLQQALLADDLHNFTNSFFKDGVAMAGHAAFTAIQSRIEHYGPDIQRHWGTDHGNALKDAYDQYRTRYNKELAESVNRHMSYVPARFATPLREARRAVSGMLAEADRQWGLDTQEGRDTAEQLQALTEWAPTSFGKYVEQNNAVPTHLIAGAVGEAPRKMRIADAAKDVVLANPRGRHRRTQGYRVPTLREYAGLETAEMTRIASQQSVMTLATDPSFSKAANEVPGVAEAMAEWQRNVGGSMPYSTFQQILADEGYSVVSGATEASTPDFRGNMARILFNEPARMDVHDVPGERTHRIVITDPVTKEPLMIDYDKWDQVNQLPDLRVVPDYIAEVSNDFLDPRSSQFAVMYDQMGQLWKTATLAWSVAWVTYNAVGNMAMANFSYGQSPLTMMKNLDKLRNELRMTNEAAGLGSKAPLRTAMRNDTLSALVPTAMSAHGPSWAERMSTMQLGDKSTRLGNAVDFVSNPDRGVVRIKGRDLSIGKVTEFSYTLNEFTDNMFRTTVLMDDIHKRLMKEAPLPKEFLNPDGTLRTNLTPDEHAQLTNISEAANKALDKSVRAALNTMGDFTRLNKLERKYVKRALPFYPWLRHQTAMAIRMPLQNPMRWAWMQSMYQMLSDDEDGDAMQSLMSGVWETPFGTIPLNAANPFGGGITALGSGTEDLSLFDPKTLLGAVNPIPKTLATIVTGKDMGGQGDVSRPQDQKSIDADGQLIGGSALQRITTGLSHGSPREMLQGVGEVGYNLAGLAPQTKGARELILGSAPRYDSGDKIPYADDRYGGRVMSLGRAARIPFLPIDLTHRKEVATDKDREAARAEARKRRRERIRQSQGRGD